MIDTNVTREKLSTHENENSESAKQNIDKNSSHENEVVGSGKNEGHEDKSLKFDFDCMSDAQELDDSAQQAILMINNNDDEMEKQLYKITSLSLSFETNISENPSYLENFGQSSIYPTTSDTENGTKKVNIGDKTLDGPSQVVLLEGIEKRLRQDFSQQMLALRQEFMSKNEANNNIRNCHNIRNMGTGPRVGQYGGQNSGKEQPDSAEEMNRSSVKNFYVDKEKVSHLNRAKDELEPAFNQRTKTALFIFIGGLLVLCLAFFALNHLEELDNYKAAQRTIEGLQNTLDAKNKQYRKTESELKLAQEELAHYKASTQRQIEDMRKGLDSKIFTPLSLGVGVADNRFYPIIKKNSQIPITVESIFGTMFNDQSSIRFSIYEGERKFVQHNNFLGDFHIEGLSKGAAGSTKVNLVFELDKNGILHVRGLHQKTDGTLVHASLELNYNEKRTADIRSIEKMIKADQAEYDRKTALANLELNIRKVQYEIANTVSHNSATKDYQCRTYEKWVSENRDASKEVFEQELKSFKIGCGYRIDSNRIILNNL